jgi:hypothetical protein
MTSEVIAVLTSAGSANILVSRTRSIAALGRDPSRDDFGAAWAPALQCITPQKRRAALRPGHSRAHVTAFTT